MNKFLKLVKKRFLSVITLVFCFALSSANALSIDDIYEISYDMQETNMILSLKMYNLNIKRSDKRLVKLIDELESRFEYNRKLFASFDDRGRPARILEYSCGDLINKYFGEMISIKDEVAMKVVAKYVNMDISRLIGIMHQCNSRCVMVRRFINPFEYLNSSRVCIPRMRLSGFLNDIDLLFNK